MIKYEEFERAVKDISENYSNWLHLLPAVPLAYRQRFISVIKRGVDVPSAFDYIMCSLRLTDDMFTSFLEEALQKKESESPA